MKITYFASSAGFRRWLMTNGATCREFWVGFYKKDSGKDGITYAEAVDEALCFGWIDGIKKRVDELSYTHRFTPRKPRSIWSQVNIRHAERLIQTGRMTEAGRKAFAGRDPLRSGIYSFENAVRTLPAGDEQRFQADPAAWKFFQQQPSGYRRTAIWWVVSAKKEATRARRLARLIEHSRRGQRLGQVTGKQ